MRFIERALIGVLVAVLSPGLTWAADNAATGRRADQAALKPYGSLVGGWRRGVGQVERGRTKGSWIEDADWAWKLTPDSAALEGKFTRGKYLRSLLIRPGNEPNTFVADAVLADGSMRTFTGKGEAQKPLVLTADAPGEGLRRITISPLHDTRLVVLLEAQEPASKRYYRLGEVGYTREGVSFAVGESGPVCIVTEGRGSIAINYKGKTYYVCCSGCKDLFNENPEAILAEAAERQKEKAKEKEKEKK
jgi:YHS domain-containing protein